jgi:hypothetical protein
MSTHRRNEVTALNIFDKSKRPSTAGIHRMRNLTV